MKKILSFLMASVLVLTTGCALSNEDSAGKEVLDTYLKNVDAYEVPVREMGEPTSYIYMDDDIAIGMLYPKTNIDVLDEAIDAWITDTATDYKKAVKEDEESIENSELEDGESVENRAELTLSYESYYTGDNYAGVKLSGTFISPALAHPIDVIKTFNVDLQKEKRISIEDVMTEDGLSALIQMLILQTGVAEEDIDEHIFDYGVLTNEGLEVVLNRGDYLPMSEGTKIAFFAYEDIVHLLADDFDYTRTSDSAERPDRDIPAYTSVPVQEREIDPNKPMVALTFDDGPSAHTERLLDIFAEHGGKGTFFVLGNLIDGREDTLKRTCAEGHEIGGHSWDHRQLTNLTEEEVKDQIMMTRAKIYDVTGQDSLIVRAPYGACDDMVQSVGKELGVSFYNWSIDTLDWLTKDPQAIEKEILDHVSDGDIILCHDLHETTVDAMESVIPKLMEEEYQLVTITELMRYSDEKVQAGELYLQE